MENRGENEVGTGLIPRPPKTSIMIALNPKMVAITKGIWEV